MTKVATENIIKLREKQHNQLNQTKINKKFYENQIVFILDRSFIVGSPKPLKPKYSPSPFVVLEVKKTSCL